MKHSSGTITTATEVVQANDPYPFGMNMAGLTYPVGSPKNSYLYNGKELQDELGINLYDYGARFYDPAIARWNGVDALAELFTYASPYNYVEGNPIRHVDPDGKTWWDKVKGGVAAVVDNATGGLVNLRDDFSYEDAADYNNGQDWGDAGSVALGTAMEIDGGVKTVLGISTMTTSVEAEVGSGGTLTVVAAPAFATGAVMTGTGVVENRYGKVISTNGIDNFKNQKGRVYAKGTNNQGKGTGRGKNNRKPNPDAEGDHSTFNDRGNTTYKKNDQNPSGFDEVKRVDIEGKPHKNTDGTTVKPPHVHEKGKNDVRPAIKGKDY